MDDAGPVAVKTEIGPHPVHLFVARASVTPLRSQ